MSHATTAEPTPAPPPDPDSPYALYANPGPFNPSFTREAVRTMFRTLPLDQREPETWRDRRMHAALLALSALHPRDEIEVMLGVQAMSAYHAAAACFRIGMNQRKPCGENTRHITAACSAARTFDTMLKALERRQAKPLATPIGRPAARTWDHAPNPTEIIAALAESCRETPPEPNPAEPKPVWTPEDLAHADAFIEKQRIEKENEGLDIANTEGILPGGGMILTDDPTPQQQAYMARRLGLAYRREYEENLRNGIRKMPKIRAIRPGDLIP